MKLKVGSFYAARGALPLSQGPQLCIATIERAFGLVASLADERRLHELGLVVVDEIHFVGEPNRGAGLELLLSIIKY